MKNVEAKEGKKAYQRVHVSFQSTGATNIGSVNCFNEVTSYIEKRERGKGINKCYWGIEMNEPHQFYLHAYNRVDVIDHMIKNCNLHLISQKWWHAAGNQGMALAVVTAYDMYLECAEGIINPEWKLKDPLSHKRFRMKLGNGCLQYDPRKKILPGDEMM